MISLVSSCVINGIIYCKLAFLFLFFLFSSPPQKLGAEDYSCMSRLLPPLEDIFLKHPEVLIQGLAADLRVVIATHGAYKPESLPAAGTMKGGRGASDATQGRNATHPPGIDRSDPQSRATSYPSTTTATTEPATDDRTRTSTDTSDPTTRCTKPLIPADTRAPAPTPTTRLLHHRLQEPLAEPPRAFSDWLLEACDPDVPTRAVALRRLTRMVQEKHPEALQAQEKVLLVG